jgi:outer membrane protein TolC
VFPVADNYSDERSAARSLHQANLTLASTDDSVRLGLRSAVLSLVTAARTVHSSEIALSYAQETYTQMQARFSAQQINANDLLSAETLLLSSQNLYTTSLYDFLRARSTLARQMGVAESDLQSRF